MTTYDETWELAQSIQPTPAGETLPPGRNGVVIARPHPTGWFVSARYRPDLAVDDLEDFAVFAQVRTYLLLADGPRELTWEPDPAGGWRAYCVRTQPVSDERLSA